MGEVSRRGDAKPTGDPLAVSSIGFSQGMDEIPFLEGNDQAIMKEEKRKVKDQEPEGGKGEGESQPDEKIPEIEGVPAQAVRTLCHQGENLIGARPALFADRSHRPQADPFPKKKEETPKGDPYRGAMRHYKKDKEDERYRNKVPAPEKPSAQANREGRRGSRGRKSKRILLRRRR
jgi:hypothetical protein